MPTPVVLTQRLKAAAEATRTIRRKLANALRREKRQHLSHASLVEQLRQADLLTDDLQTQLHSYSGWLIVLCLRLLEKPALFICMEQ